MSRIAALFDALGWCVFTSAYVMIIRAAMDLLLLGTYLYHEIMYSNQVKLVVS